MLSVRLVTLDHYSSRAILKSDGSYDSSRKFSSPVLRVFGPTSTGLKACVHIHGVYPYLYVPYEGGENSDRDCMLLAVGLDRALQAAADAEKSFVQRYVHRVTLVSGIPLYGYHSRPRQFMKVYFLNPYSVRKAADLLLNGAILNMKLQPHESHIPFTQQFMIDYNLFGMSYINFAKVKYRRNPDAPDALPGVELDQLLPGSVKKISHSFIEIDVLAEDILNRMEDKSAAANPGLAGIWAEERERRHLAGRSSLPTPLSTQTRSEKLPFGIEVDHLQDLEIKLRRMFTEASILEVPSNEPHAPYPAELQDDSNIMDASTVLDVRQVVDEAGIAVSYEEALVNETIVQELTQRGLEDEHVDGETEEGRAEEAESEEDEDGPDMTQPLDAPAVLTAVRERSGDSSSDSEVEFWREMADEIFQLDGAVDSSGTSDDQQNIMDSPSFDASDSLSNIMSILGESDCLAMLPSSQASPEFWGGNPPWEQWSSWNTPAPTLSPVVPNTLSPPSAVLTPASEVDRYSDFYMDGITDLSVMQSPMPFPETPFSMPPPSVEEPLQIEPVHDVPQSLPPLENPKNNIKELHERIKRLIQSRSNESTNKKSLTLREYLKSLGDIVRVDFRVINETEMVVIEYKPTGASCPQVRNRFLIKPLFKFIEEWNIAELGSNANKALPAAKAPKYINGYTQKPKKIEKLKKVKEPEKLIVVDKEYVKRLENKYSGKKVVKNRQKKPDKFVVKSIEVVDDSNKVSNKELKVDTNSIRRSGKTYCINESVISKDKITLKLVKSRNDVRKHISVSQAFKEKECGKEKASCHADDVQSLDNTLTSSVAKTDSSEALIHHSGLGCQEIVPNNSSHYEKVAAQNISPVNNKQLSPFRPNDNQHSQDIICESDVKTEPVDGNIIHDLNAKFEEYYHNIVKNSKQSDSNVSVKSEFEVIDLCCSDEETKEENRKQPVLSPDKANLDPVRFVSELLSTYSTLPQTGRLPPLSITVNIGDLPVHVSVRPALSHNPAMDGPNDSSSDDSSDFRSDSGRSSKRKRAKYKPLQVVLQKSPLSAGRSSSPASHSRSGTPVSHLVAKKPERSLLPEFQELEAGCSGASPSACRKPGRQLTTRRPRKTKQSKEVENVTRGALKHEPEEHSETKISTNVRIAQQSTAELDDTTDFIGGSDNEESSSAILKKRIPQTDVFASSSDDELCKSDTRTRLNLKRKRRKSKGEKVASLAEKDKEKKSDSYVSELKRETNIAADHCVTSIPLQKKDSGIIVGKARKEHKLSTITCLPIELKTGAVGLMAPSSIHSPLDKAEQSGIKVNLADCTGGGVESGGTQVVSASLSFSINAFEKPGSNLDRLLIGSQCINVDKEESSLKSKYNLETAIKETYSQHVASLDGESMLFPMKEEAEQENRELNDWSPPTEGYSPNSSALTGPIFRDVSLFGETTIPAEENNESHNFSSIECASSMPEEFPCIQVDKVEGRKSFTPMCRPPNVQEVLSTINSYCTTGRKPFYSDYRDITKPVEIGSKILKIENRTCADLKVFKSSLDILGIEDHQKLQFGEDIDQVKFLFVQDKNIEITPLCQPPSCDEVKQWLSNRSKSVDVQEGKPKAKLLLPGGGGSDSEGDDVTLTPVTPALSDSSLSSTPVTTPRNLDPPLVTNAAATPLARPKAPTRRVSFDESSLSRSYSPTTPKNRSTPFTKGRSESPTLPTLEEGITFQIKGSVTRLKGRRRLKMGKARESRRVSTDSNRSVDMFDRAEKEMDDNGAVEENIEENVAVERERRDNSCIIQGISFDNTFGFKASPQNLQDAKPRHDFQLITMLTLEILTEVRGEFLPDPELDAILAIFYSVAHDIPPNQGPTKEIGVFTVGNPLIGTAIDVKTTVFPDESAMLRHLVVAIRLWDPDVLVGYEIEQASWGYILQRGCILGMNILSQIGRIVSDNQEPQSLDSQENTDNVPKFIRHLCVPGRIVINAWRLLRKEIALTSYTFENIMFHLVHERHSLIPLRVLSQLWQHRTPRSHYIPAEYFLTRITGLERILVQLDLIARTSELARLFGIQFTEVLTRGSQFRVESMMLRLAKPLNFVPVSPSMTQRAQMRAPASLPLIMEPESQFYSDPVIVLDFQSLYPSMIIAYNYCFSTCLGRASNLGQSDDPFEFGCTRLSVPLTDLLPFSEDENVHVSPAGVAFVKVAVRKGVLPAMLEEILDTRLMVKRAMKESIGDKVLHKMLHARQLGLKLIANVTYGYTAANFSGRMPCIEVGDSVVSKGRETLQRAIRMVESTPQWGARVVYGDTDSLFVQTPGKSREEAFRIGAEIADAVTMDNPHPVKLKLEKVYQPCILQTKKRYVGYMYECPSQTEPTYDAKGIETVRRDGCPAVAKILEKSLHILFDTSDVSLVKKYCVRQFAKIFQGRVNLQDLIFAKEYRGRKGYRPGACVPALQLARQWSSIDKRAEPRVKERVPYVIAHGAPGVPLIRLVRSPKEMLKDSSLRIHAAYYITKALIPPLQRCFMLLGADPFAWYSAMPRRFHRMVRTGLTDTKRRQTISQYFAAIECVVCGTVSNARICPGCSEDPQKVGVVLVDKARNWERSYSAVLEVCKSCCGRADFIDCESLDCPVLFRRHQLSVEAEQAAVVRDILQSMAIS